METKLARITQLSTEAPNIVFTSVGHFLNDEMMGYFGLQLEESKSRLTEFGKYAEGNHRRRGEGKPVTFTFLGFTHYCLRSLFYWLNRRSQKVSCTWSQFADMLKVYPLVRPPNICQYIYLSGA